MSIVLEQLTKRYGGHPVVNQVSLEVANGEFFVLLGPSGSGKSTVLRMIAGLTGINAGRILLHGTDVTSMPAQGRDVGFVFQNYALFRHMSVAENIEFALRVRKIAAPDRRRRRDTLLELVGLAGLGSRMPYQLSGGQQQRVALARALAHPPAVLLLDEPFGALDAKIRTELRRNLKVVQRELNLTTIFVTHDQEEAFELADRLGVMNAGRLLEVGPAEELYQRPQTEFVATFLGTANLLVGAATASGVQVGPLHFPLSTEVAQVQDTQRVQVLFRPEDIALAPAAEDLPGPALGQATVVETTFSGSFERLRLHLPPLPQVRVIAPAVPFGGDVIEIDALRAHDQVRQFPLSVGELVWVGVRRMHALTHPGLRCLILGDGSPSAQTTQELAGQLVRLAHARTTLLLYGLDEASSERLLQGAKETIGSGLPALELRNASGSANQAIRQELERENYDLAVLGIPAQSNLDLAEHVLQSSNAHLLLVPGPQAHPTPSRVLICVAGGEPGKEDVLFAGRLLRHFGATATVLSVLRPGQAEQQAKEFVSACARTLGLLGVPADTLILTGPVRETILDVLEHGNYELLVLGAPLPNLDGRTELAGVVGQLLGTTAGHPVLIVRSQSAGRVIPGMGSDQYLIEEVTR